MPAKEREMLERLDQLEADLKETKGHVNAIAESVLEIAAAVDKLKIVDNKPKTVVKSAPEDKEPTKAHQKAPKAKVDKGSDPKE